MVLVDGKGTPLGLHVDSASPSEVKLLSFTLASVKAGLPGKKPERLIGDRGYDSNPVRKELVAAGIEPVIPARRNNKRATHQDGRCLRRYRRRWIIERTNAWLQNSSKNYTNLEPTQFPHLPPSFLVLSRSIE